MPALVMIAASGTAQRRLIHDVSAELEKREFSAAGKSEGGEWNYLLSDNMSGGLFDDKSYIIVESAQELGPFPPALALMAESEETASTVLLLVYDDDAKQAKIFPKELLPKIRVVKPPKFPVWPRERQLWTLNLAKELGANMQPEAAAVIVELMEDPEEIRSQITNLKLLKAGSAITPDDVFQMCIDDGSRNILRLIDGLCSGNFPEVFTCLKAIAKNGEVIPSLVPIHNRMRLAWYAGLNCAAFKNALAPSKDYAWKMGLAAHRKYGHKKISAFMADILRINIDERSGTGSGWCGLEMAIIKLMS